MPGPTLSLLLANYNHAALLPRALAHLLGQTQAPLEIVLVDDGSTDDSRAVIAALAADQPLLRVVWHERNQGVCAAYNRAAAEARGRYVFCFACDDWAAPDLVERTTALLAAHPDATVCCWDAAGYEPETGAVLPDPRGWSAEPTAYSAADMPAVLRRKGHLTCAVTVLDREAFVAVGGLRPELRWYSDWFAATVMALRGGVCYVPGALSAFWQRADSYCQRGHRDWAALRQVVPTMLDLLDSPEFRDVRDGFRDLGLLRVVGWRGLSLIAAHRRLRPYVTPKLVQAVMVDCVLRTKAKLFPYLPPWLLAAWRRLVKLWRRPPAPVASEGGCRAD